MADDYAALAAAMKGFGALMHRTLEQFASAVGQHVLPALADIYGNLPMPLKDELAFRAALAANPGDGTARGAYADWLDEHERPGDAAPQRVLADPGSDARRLEYAAAVGPRDPARAESVRVQVELARAPGFGSNARWVELANRAEELQLAGRRNGTDWRAPLVELVPGGRSVFHRGFVSGVECTAADWLAHGDTIRESHPVTGVVLTTVPTAGMGGFENDVPVMRKWFAARYPGIEFTLPLRVHGMTAPGPRHPRTARRQSR